MSGRFNNPPQQNGGWSEFTPQGPGGGKYEKYQNQVVVIVHVSSGQKKSKSHRILLTDAVLKALGNPKRVKVLTRGSNVGLMGVKDDSTDAYSVTKSSSGSDESIRYLNTSAFISQYNIAGGVYAAHLESGVVVFDTQSMPSRP